MPAAEPSSGIRSSPKEAMVRRTLRKRSVILLVAIVLASSVAYVVLRPGPKPRPAPSLPDVRTLVVRIPDSAPRARAAFREFITHRPQDIREFGQVVFGGRPWETRSGSDGYWEISEGWGGDGFVTALDSEGKEVFEVIYLIGQRRQRPLTQRTLMDRLEGLPPAMAAVRTPPGPDPRLFPLGKPFIKWLTHIVATCPEVEPGD